MTRILRIYVLKNFHIYHRTMLIIFVMLYVIWWFSGKESTCQCRRQGFNAWVRKIPWRRNWHPTPVLLPRESHGQRSPAGYCPWGRTESDTTERLHRITSLVLITGSLYFLTTFIQLAVLHHPKSGSV